MTVEERLKMLEREQAETKAELARLSEAHAQAQAQVVAEVRARAFVLEHFKFL